MRKQRGVTLTELVVSGTLLVFMLTGVLALLVTGLRSFERTTNDINLAQPSAQAIRRVSESLRMAMSVTISPDRNSVTFTLPKFEASNDPVTGEKEITYPQVSDGVTRSFTVNSRGELVEMPGRRVLLSGIAVRDPDPASSQSNQVYEPFQTTTIGARNAVTMNFITSNVVNSRTRYVRMKSTVMVQNIK